MTGALNSKTRQTEWLVVLQHQVSGLELCVFQVMCHCELYGFLELLGEKVT